MKRFNLISMLMIILMLVVGCTTIGNQSPNIDQDSKEVIAKISGRRIGAELQKRYPDVAVEVYVLCYEIATSDKPNIVDIVIRRLIKVLADEIDDKLLVTDINDLLELLKIKPDVGILPEQLSIIISATKGLTNGIELQKEIKNGK